MTDEPVEPATPAKPAFAEVAQAAARAFDLVPAGRGEGRRGQDSGLAQRLKTDPETVERDLIKLVLTIVELLRQLMERTALHRVDQGDLTEEQEERVGMTLMILQDRMTELCERYGLTMADLNLDLGPLGSLLPPHDTA
ncbi:gas vesicle protein K [Streptomyces lydicus]|uniref:gas vesicle protein K n=1 Tax=Streptomyces lydicus TaxID=47763 RepID=UPI001010F01A|nr:gas vesicle protein K [Streptomyces lydicus]MCZ1005733.1 gas vesicle protein K [Streptomyces lydicus]